MTTTTAHRARTRDLTRMKRIALALLGAAALVYAAAVALQGRHPAWGYVAAFAEAAMVGAVADWFAVVALFRHPLGLPIPHTAIIPSNKDRIGENLATFICANFLSTEQVLAKLRELDPAARLAAWLAEPRHAASLAEHLSSALAYALGVLDDDRVRTFFRSTVVARLEQVDVTRLAGQLLDVLTAQHRHQQLLDGLLQQLARMLDDETLKAQVAEVIAAEVKYLRFVGLDNVAGRYATEKMVAGVVRLVGEMGADPNHPLRSRFDGFAASFIERLKDDPELRSKGEAIKQELLAHPALSTYLHGLWSETIAWVQGDLAQPGSTIREQAMLGTRSLGEKLLADSAMRNWINEQIRSAAPRWIERYREDIRGYIVARVSSWNAAEMTRELEANIGRDLQFIRINGTLVGGLVGLAIYSATQWLARG
ncbi:MAG: DUF445 domain-containing protein [Pseudomonadota bacterium]|nr:DUF445 domain-containing protein [Pseudomonadota bacterium]